MVMCLCRLHNYCINQHLAAKEPLCVNNFNVESWGGVTAEGTPGLMSQQGMYFRQRSHGETMFSRELLRGGHHFRRVTQTERRRELHQANSLP
jgi:hypothetical protein